MANPFERMPGQREGTAEMMTCPKRSGKDPWKARRVTDVAAGGRSPIVVRDRSNLATVGAEKSNSVEVYEVGWSVRDPHLGLPCYVREVARHHGSVRESSHIDYARRRTREKSH